MASGSHSRPMSVPPVGAPQAMVLSPDDVQQGNVLWLAPHRETVASLQGRRGVSRQPVLSLVKRMGPEPAFYNHPILVISRPKQSPYSIHFLLVGCTTFDDVIRVTNVNLAHIVQWQEYHETIHGFGRSSRLARISSGLSCCRPSTVCQWRS